MPPLCQLQQEAHAKKGTAPVGTTVLPIFAVLKDFIVAPRATPILTTATASATRPTISEGPKRNRDETANRTVIATTKVVFFEREYYPDKHKSSSIISKNFLT